MTTNVIPLTRRFLHGATWVGGSLLAIAVAGLSLITAGVLLYTWLFT